MNIGLNFRYLRKGNEEEKVRNLEYLITENLEIQETYQLEKWHNNMLNQLTIK